MGEDHAYYFPQWIWPRRHLETMKVALLFFDGLVLTLPHNVAVQAIDTDPVLAGPLADLGLLKNIEPREWMDLQTAEAFSNLVLNLITSRGYEAIARDADRWRDEDGPEAIPMDDVPPQFLEAGAPWRTERSTGRRVLREMQKRGLVSKQIYHTIDHVDPSLRSLLLVVLAHAFRITTASTASRVHPVGAGADAGARFAELLAHVSPRRAVEWEQPRPSSFLGPAVQSDYSVLGPDLSTVPLDDILAFRREHGEHYRAYARGLRSFLRETAALGEQDWSRALDDRREAIRQEAYELRRRSRSAFGRITAAAALTLLASSWTALHDGDPVGAALAALAAATGLPLSESPATTAYTYVIEMRNLA
jgi:hypothetical protein